MASIVAWLTDKPTKATDAAHLSDHSRLLPVLQLPFFVCLEIVILNLMYSFKEDEEEERG